MVVGGGYCKLENFVQLLKKGKLIVLKQFNSFIFLFLLFVSFILHSGKIIYNKKIVYLPIGKTSKKIKINIKTNKSNWDENKNTDP